MIILELDAIEVDYCPVCGGVWLDAGEMGILLGDAAKEEKVLQCLHAPEAPCQEQRFPCPICRKRMTKCAMEDPLPVLIIDRCPSGHGLWFDAGELALLLSSPLCKADSRVVSLVREMFATHIPTMQGRIP